MKLYSKKDLGNIPWPENDAGEYAKSFFTPILEKGTQFYFKNINTSIFILIYNDKVIPINLASSNLDDAYVTSPYCHFISYAKEELYLISNSVLRLIFRLILNILGFLFKACKINKVVYINNWFLSTNLHPEFTSQEVEKIKKFLIIKFPNHTQVFRSANEDSNEDLIEVFAKSKFKKVFSRQVYILKKFENCKVHKDYRNDCKLLSKTAYKIENPRIENAQRLSELYNDLYINKYSQNNPQFTKEFLEVAIKHKLLKTVHLSKGGNIEAYYGYFQRNGIMTAPLFGVNNLKAKEDGLYRILSLLLIQEAEKESLTLNNSSGASKFKMHRGAEAVTEYMMVYCPSHSYKSIPWILLQIFVTPLARVIFKKYKL